jgi:hypothetical protein
MAPIGSSNNSNFYLNLNQKLNPRLVNQRKELPVSTSSNNPNSRSSKVPESSFLAQKEITPPPHNPWQPYRIRLPTLPHLFTLVLPKMTAGGTDGETQLLENFNLAMEILLDADKSLVIYVWPKKLAQHIAVQPYSKKHLDE